MKRCYSYSRVSSEQQVENYSIETQQAEMRAYAEANDLEIIKEFTENGVTGAKLNRPSLNELRDSISEVEVILFYDPDRMSRNLVNQIILKEEFDKAGVELIFVKGGAVGNTPEEKMLFNMRGVFAEYELTKITERTTRGRRQRLKNGLFAGGNGSNLFGYTCKEGKREVNPQTSQVVKHIYKLFLEGEAINNIVVRLSTQGIKSPKGQDSWNRVAIYKILTNRAYTGKATFWGIELCQPQLIPLADFEKAQLRLQRNRELGRHSPNSSYLFSGYIFCHECGKRYIGSASHHIRYYCCPGGSKNVRVNPCQGKSLRADKVETELWLTLESALSNPDYISGIGLEDITDDDYEPELIALKARLKFYQNERKSLWHLYCETKDLATFKELIKPLGEKTEQANKRYTEIQELIKASGQRPDPSDIEEACQRIYESMGQLAYEDRRKVLEALKVRFDPVTRRLEINLPCRVREESVRLGETLRRGG